MGEAEERETDDEEGSEGPGITMTLFDFSDEDPLVIEDSAEEADPSSSKDLGSIVQRGHRLDGRPIATPQTAPPPLPPLDLASYESLGSLESLCARTNELLHITPPSTEIASEDTFGGQSRHASL